MQAFRTIKKEIRIIGWDDGPFKFKSKGKTVLIGAVFRGGQFMDGVLKTEINIDGNDAENKIIVLMKKAKFKDLRIIMLDGITFAGFNAVNIKNIYEKTGLPVIVVNRKRPDLERFKKSAKRLRHSNKIIKAVEDAGPVYHDKLYFQCAGINKQDASKVIRISTTRSKIPEPLRVAHLIASGIILGESVGRA